MFAVGGEEGACVRRKSERGKTTQKVSVGKRKFSTNLYPYAIFDAVHRTVVPTLFCTHP